MVKGSVISLKYYEPLHRQEVPLDKNKSNNYRTKNGQEKTFERPDRSASA